MHGIPAKMVQRQIRWEWVNSRLYQYLTNANQQARLEPFLAELVAIQVAQGEALAALSERSEGWPLLQPLPVEEPAGVLPAVEELRDREYQLLQEYLACAQYFLAGDPEGRELAEALAALQQRQVDLLSDLRSTYRALAGARGRHGDHLQGDDGAETYRLEAGYRLERVVDGLTFPTGITFDDQGQPCVVEAGFAYGTEPGPGRVLRLEPDGRLTEVAGGLPGPVTGATYHGGSLYVAAGARGRGDGTGGQIVRIAPDGHQRVIIDGLPTGGDHFTGEILFGPDERLYFHAGTATNSGVVGTDNIPWLKQYPGFHDRPARPLLLSGQNYISPDPLSGESDVAITGAYKPFGQPGREGEPVEPARLANGAIYRCNPDGSGLELVADGFRNPFGLRFGPDGQLYASDNGADERGSRPLGHDWDNLWAVTPGGWHGWPDFFSGLPATLPHFQVEGARAPGFVLKQHPPLAGQPLVRFTHHAAATKFDFSTSAAFGHVGQVFLAQIGTVGWGHHEAPLGFRVVRFHPLTGQIRDFLVNPVGDERYGGPIRPVEARFSPDGRSLWVVDFGIQGRVEDGLNPERKTGALWRVVPA